MNSYLSNLIGRTQQSIPMLRPRPVSRFESLQPDATSLDEQTAVSHPLITEITDTTETQNVSHPTHIQTTNVSHPQTAVSDTPRTHKTNTSHVQTAASPAESPPMVKPTKSKKESAILSKMTVPNAQPEKAPTLVKQQHAIESSVLNAQQSRPVEERPLSIPSPSTRQLPPPNTPDNGTANPMLTPAQTNHLSAQTVPVLKKKGTSPQSKLQTAVMPSLPTPYVPSTAKKRPLTLEPSAVTHRLVPPTTPPVFSLPDLVKSPQTLAETAVSPSSHSTKPHQAAVPTHNHRPNGRFLLTAPPIPSILGRETAVGIPQAPPATQNGQDTTAAPTIQVKIGRIEVRANSVPAQPTPQKKRPNHTVLTLDDYLNQRHRQGGVR